MKITKAQIKAIHTAKAQIFQTEEDYRDWLFKNFGVVSSRDLSYSQAREAVGLLMRFTGYDKTNKRASYRITKAQLNRIKSLEIIAGWNDNPQRLLGFIEKQTGKQTTPEMLTKAEAKKIIIGLLRILSNGNKDLFKMLNTQKYFDPESPAGKAIIKTIKRKLEK